MKYYKALSVLMVILLAHLFITGCNSSNDDVSEIRDETSPATIDYLCSTLLWVYVPDNGIKKGEYESFFFGKIGDDMFCTITKDNGESNVSSLKRYNCIYTPPTISLKEREEITGKDVPGGESRTITVYKLTRKGYSDWRSSSMWLQINGKPYLSTLEGGINLN